MAICPTCMAVEALMRSRGVPEMVSERVAYSEPIRSVDTKVKAKVKRGATKASRNLSKALKKTNALAKKKNGSFKKGWSQSRVMKDAHKLVARMK